MSVLQQIMTLVQKHYYNMGDIPKAINQEYLGDEIETILARHKDTASLVSSIANFIQSQLVPCGVCGHNYDDDKTTDGFCDDLMQIEY